MATRSASWSRPADECPRVPAALVVVVATGLFLTAWWGLHRDFFVQEQISKLLPAAVKNLSNANSGKGLLELGGEVLCHLRGPQLGMLGPET